jgi:hypothetical protein
MTRIIKANQVSDKSSPQEITVAVSASKTFICVYTVKTYGHLKCYTQTWVVESHYGSKQEFKDFFLADSYFTRLPA